MGAEAAYEANPEDPTAIARLAALQGGLERDMKNSYPDEYAQAINSLSKISTDAETVIAFIEAKDEPARSAEEKSLLTTYTDYKDFNKYIPALTKAINDDLIKVDRAEAEAQAEQLKATATSGFNDEVA